MNTLEEILNEANKYLRPLPKEADPTKMNEEDNIRSIEMRERLEPIERAEIEPKEIPEYDPEDQIMYDDIEEFPPYIQEDGKIMYEDPLGRYSPKHSVRQLDYKFAARDQVQEGETELAVEKILRLTRDLSPGSPRDGFKPAEPDLRYPKIEEEILKIATKDPYLAFRTLNELSDRGMVTYTQWANLSDKIDRPID